MTKDIFELSGKVAFVAGGTSGINLGIAKALALAGVKVALISRSQEKVDAAVDSLNAAGCLARGWSADVRDFAAVDGALKAAHEIWGEIDIVISGAAGNFLASALTLSANAFKTVVDIDLIGTFNVLRASFAYLRKPGASLISISAPQGAVPTPLQAHACAAKAGVNMLTKCLAMEWGPAGVRVNAVSPGPVSGTEGMARLAPSPDAAAAYTSRLALRRFANVDEIANAALFLASDRACYVTGAILDCDGGNHLGDASLDALNFRRS